MFLAGRWHCVLTQTPQFGKVVGFFCLHSLESVTCNHEKRFLPSSILVSAFRKKLVHSFGVWFRVPTFEQSFFFPRRKVISARTFESGIRNSPCSQISRWDFLLFVLLRGRKPRQIRILMTRHLLRAPTFPRTIIILVYAISEALSALTPLRAANFSETI